MKHPWHTWLIFGLCLAIVLAAMAWISMEALRLERSEGEMRRKAAIEEDVRLALWRMDSALGPSIARENARPWYVYNAFYRTQGVYGLASAKAEQGDVLVASPLLASEYPNILLFFQFGPDGTLTSPQVPTGNVRDLAEGTHVAKEQIERAAKRLTKFQALVSREALLTLIGEEPAPLGPFFEERVDAHFQGKRPVAHAAGQHAPVRALPVASDVAIGILGAYFCAGEVDLPRYDESAQAVYNANEYEARVRNRRQVPGLEAGLWDIAHYGPMPTGTSLEAVWIDSALVLARKVLVNGQEYIQGCWLDWPGLKEALLDEIRNLLPGASLEPAASAKEPGRMLAALPVRIVPGHSPTGAMPFSSPIRLSLVIAWGCVLLGAVAAAVLLMGTVRLSERRGTFVSAVTHELRSPLTTFRIYTDLLAQGAVQDEAKRHHYVSTLRAEADRLSHLVENVLAYARLTGKRTGRFAETVAVPELIGRLKDRLDERASRADMQLVVEGSEAACSTTVTVDPSVVEQILLNLVDNACKYAASATDRRLHLETDRAAGTVLLRVRDHGPGIPNATARRLFRPFSKSAHEAADTAAGIGLGLALSRRLARDLGGDLKLSATERGGACFELILPAA